MYVLELSSFQLERTSCLNATAATVLNISTDHQDRHNSILDYAKIKQRIFSGNGVMIINDDDLKVKKMSSDLVDRKILTFSVHNKRGFHLENRQNEYWLMNEEKPLIRKSELSLEGLHNTANALAALALGTAVGLKADTISSVLRRFKGLQHRMQKVAKVNGVTWVNDSKATNIGACIAALQGYQEKVILIAGGDAKGADMNELIPVIKEKTRFVVLMGKDADLLESKIAGCVPSYRANTIKQAVQIASTMAERGESVLLSPACASLDQYKNYQERGEQFSAAVLELAA
jgi:UDP-N-acetylmuramoylalanine--D-glutamate ligase